MRKAVGIDLGGTFMKGAVVAQGGEILVKDEIPTRADEGAERVLERLAVMIRDLATRAQVSLSELAGIGVTIPGFLDRKTGVAKEVVNMGWRDVPVGQLLGSALELPIRLENDANAAAFGEAIAGAGKGRVNVLCVTLGTGVGGGIVLDRRILHGQSDMAGEIGHIVLDPEGALCNCGHRGCLETTSSATGVSRMAKEAVASGVETTLAQCEEITAKDVFMAAARGDEAASHVVARAIERLGQGLAIAANLLNPDIIVVGGGMSRAGDALFHPLQHAFSRYALTRVRHAVQVVPATLGNDAGVVGVAHLAFE